MVKGTPFHNGTIEVEMAGLPAKSASEGARGFIGLAFRLRDGRFEYIYLRPTNGRADDQVRRNHSTRTLLPRLRFRALPQGSAESTRATWISSRGLDAGPHHRAGDSRAALRPRSGAARTDRERSRSSVTRRATLRSGSGRAPGVFHGSFNQARVGKAVGTAGWSGAGASSVRLTCRL